jgi:type II secretory pathway pseudopilin PulG
MVFNKEHQKAFTIPELLVLISIIGIIVIIVWVIISGASSAQVRDVERVAGTDSLRTALKLYHADHGKYPEQEGTWCSVESQCTTLNQELVNGGYLTKIPEDPLFGKGMEETNQLFSYQYMSTSSGEGYRIYVDMEDGESYEIYAGLGSQLTYTYGVDGGGDPEGEDKRESGWIKVYGSTSEEGAWDIRETGDGYIITGHTNSWGTENLNMIFTKTDLNGVEQWTKTFGDSFGQWSYGRSIKKTSDGYILGGYTANGTGLFLKLDQNGDKQWSTVFGEGTLPTDYAFITSVHEIGSGYVLGARTSCHGASGLDFLVVKLDSSGDQVWARAYGENSSEIFRSLEKTSDGGYIIAGTTDGFGVTGEDILLIKIDQNGKIEWAKTYGHQENDQVSYDSVHEISEGYIVGGTIDYGAFSKNPILLRLDSSGDIIWKKEYKEAEKYFTINSLNKTSDGGYVFGGMQSGWDSFLLKVDSTGEVAWANTYGSDQSVINAVRGVSNGYIAAGNSGLGWGAGQGDLLLIKTDQNGDITNCSKQVERTITVSDIALFNSNDVTNLISTSALVVAKTLSEDPTQKNEDLQTTDICPDL